MQIVVVNERYLRQLHLSGGPSELRNMSEAERTIWWRLHGRSVLRVLIQDIAPLSKYACDYLSIAHREVAAPAAPAAKEDWLCSFVKYNSYQLHLNVYVVQVERYIIQGQAVWTNLFRSCKGKWCHKILGFHNERMFSFAL